MLADSLFDATPKYSELLALFEMTNLLDPSSYSSHFYSARFENCDCIILVPGLACLLLGHSIMLEHRLRITKLSTTF